MSLADPRVDGTDGDEQGPTGKLRNQCRGIGTFDDRVVIEMGKLLQYRNVGHRDLRGDGQLNLQELYGFVFSA